ncbi:MAG: hypothetical protein P794_08970 [Epsilonproteobacteria bacterium (ex Lamellibrachia satsuma)]|nr:MAG: hypothetical protein P794_08970 [Epsilonproteobacteria bacterium (ex Lamellibrachia satsuma)]
MPGTFQPVTGCDIRKECRGEKKEPAHPFGSSIKIGVGVEYTLFCYTFIFIYLCPHLSKMLKGLDLEKSEVATKFHIFKTKSFEIKK